MERKKIAIELIETNEGQIPGVPANPRFIKDEKYESLKKSIIGFPEMLTIREVAVFPLNGRYIALGGNMRFLACKDLGYKEINCVVLPAGMSVEKLREFAIKDNNSFGAWDFDLLANNWDETLLKDWGTDIPNFETDDEITDISEKNISAFKLEVTFESEQKMQEIYENLTNQGFLCKVLIF